MALYATTISNLVMNRSIDASMIGVNTPHSEKSTMRVGPRSRTALPGNRGYRYGVKSRAMPSRKRTGRERPSTSSSVTGFASRNLFCTIASISPAKSRP